MPLKLTSLIMGHRSVVRKVYSCAPTLMSLKKRKFKLAAPTFSALESSLHTITYFLLPQTKITFVLIIFFLEFIKMETRKTRGKEPHGSLSKCGVRVLSEHY